MKLSNRGFTIIEMMLAVTLFSIVMVAAYGIFSMGMQIWKRSQGRSVMERKAIIALEKIGTDFHRAIRTQTEDYKGHGNNRQLYLPSLVPYEYKKNKMIQYGQIVYKWDSTLKEVRKGILTAGDLEAGSDPTFQMLAQGVTGWKFRYLVYEKAGGGYTWYDDFNEQDFLPLAIEIEMELESLLKGEKFSRKKTFKRLIWIPAGGFYENEEMEEKTSETQAATEAAEANQTETPPVETGVTV